MPSLHLYGWHGGAGNEVCTAAAFRRDDWNDVIIRCKGAAIKVMINGITTVDYVEKEADIAREGIIGLQVHGGPAQEASYRRIRIKSIK